MANNKKIKGWEKKISNLEKTHKEIMEYIITYKDRLEANEVPPSEIEELQLYIIALWNKGLKISEQISELNTKIWNAEWRNERIPSLK